jgi:hypothetical protein
MAMSPDDKALCERLRREAEIAPHEVYIWLNPLLIETAARIEALSAERDLFREQFACTNADEIAIRALAAKLAEALDSILSWQYEQGQTAREKSFVATCERARAALAAAREAGVKLND